MFKVRVGSIKSMGANVSISINERESTVAVTPERKGRGGEGGGSEGGGEQKEENVLKKRVPSKRILKASPSQRSYRSLESSDSLPTPEPVDFKTSTYSQVQRQSRTFKPHHSDRLKGDPLDLL